MTDYLFVPGSDGAENLGRTIISRSPNTTLITRPGPQNHLAGLLAHLTTATAIARPIGDIILVAHGADTGFYFIPLSRSLSSHDRRAWVWLGVRKQTGRGEGSSGLAFDQIIDSPPAS